MLKLTLMKHTFEVRCEPEEKERLIEAATLLEDKLDQVTSLRGESKVLMVALNQFYDYLRLKADTEHYCHHLEQQLDQLAKDTAKIQSFPEEPFVNPVEKAPSNNA